MNNLKIVIIERPYDLIQSSEQVRLLLPKVFKLKLDGYRPHYQYGVMPVDDTDFWGTHLLLCKEDKEGLTPVMGFKTLTLNDSQRFNREFPLFTHSLNTSGCEYHKQQTKAWMDKNALTGDIAYNHSWTVCPTIHSDPNLKKICLELTSVLKYIYFTEYEIAHIILACSKRFKVDRTMSSIGFEYLKDDQDNAMPAFKAAGFAKEEFYIMHLNNFQHSDSVKFLYNKYRELWKNRLTLRRQEDEEELAKAA